MRGTQLRWFFKHALRNFLPPAVLSKQKHGFGLPVGAWLIGHKPLLDLAGDSIAGFIICCALLLGAAAPVVMSWLKS